MGETMRMHRNGRIYLFFLALATVLAGVVLLSTLNAGSVSASAAQGSVQQAATGAPPGTGSGPSPTATGVRFATRTPTATAVEPIFAQYGADNLFPMLIRPWTAVRLAADKILSIKVRVFQQGILDQEIEVPVNGDNVRILGDNASIIFFAWPLTVQTAPQPFKELSFTWTLESPKGTFLTSDPYFLMYQDPRYKWGAQTDAPIALYWQNPSLNIKFLSDNLKRAYTLLQQNAGMSQQYQFVIYEPNAAYCDKDPKRPGDKVVIAVKDLTVYPCDPQNTPRLYAARGMRLIQRSSALIEQLQDDLITLIANDAYSFYFKDAPQLPPAWFQSGLVQIYGFVGRANALLLAREQARQDRLLTLDQLATLPQPQQNDFGATVRNWNSQAYMFVLYLAARFGVSTPIDLSKQALTAPSFDAALTTVTKGVPLARLYADWKLWLLTSDADNAIRWNIYITQPTPTLTLTATDYPTFTPIPFVPTDTPTPFPSRTPLPTATPTQPTATNTARPAGSLASPTP